MFLYCVEHTCLTYWNRIRFDIFKWWTPSVSFISEFLPRKNRGCIMVVITLCGALGALCTASLAWALLPRFGWRWFLAACALPACLVLLYRLWFSFESPRYLFISGQRDRGLDVLREIAKQNNTSLPTSIIIFPFPFVYRNAYSCCRPTRHISIK